MKGMKLIDPTTTLKDTFLTGREAHRALARHLGSVDLTIPDHGERLGVDAIVFTLRGGPVYRVSREPQGICVRRILGN